MRALAAMGLNYEVQPVVAAAGLDGRKDSMMSVLESGQRFDVQRLVSDTDYVCHMLTKLCGFTSSLCKACSICLMHKTAYCVIFLQRDPS